MWVRVSDYKHNFKSFAEDIKNGRVTISLSDGGKRIAHIEDGRIVEDKFLRGKKFEYWVKYGVFHKERQDGTTHKIFHYRQKTSRGLHGLTKRKDLELLGIKGTTYTFYSRGKFIWQKFMYSNRRTAYYFRWTDKEVKGAYPDGTPLFLVQGEIDMRKHQAGLIFFNKGHQYNSSDELDLSKTGNYKFTFYDPLGGIINKGEFENSQRVGEWVKNKKNKYYIMGLEISKKMYFTPSDKLNPKLVLNTNNAQMRAMLLNRIGLARIVKECNGVLVHKQRKMRLWDFPIKTDDGNLRILKVVCPTTNNDYFLPVPPDINKCERARQWTLGVDRGKPLRFVLET